MGLNCPGDPGCPGYVDPNVNQAILNAFDTYNYPAMPPGGNGLPIDDSGGPHAQTLTQFINANAGTIALVGAGIFGLTLLKGMR